MLEHLLAARLAERHGVNLYTDPDAAPPGAVPHPRDDGPVGLDRPGDPDRMAPTGDATGSGAASRAARWPA